MGFPVSLSRKQKLGLGGAATLLVVVGVSCAVGGAIAGWFDPEQPREVDQGGPKEHRRKVRA